MNSKTDIASADQKARMRLDAERFFTIEYPANYTRPELTKLYARDVSRLLNEIDRQAEMITEKDSKIEILESEKITLINRANRIEEFKDIFSPPPVSAPAKITFGYELWKELSAIKNRMLKEAKAGKTGSEDLRFYGMELAGLLEPESQYITTP